MRISLQWISEYFGGKLGAISPEEISYILVKQGIEVEQITHLGKGLDRVVVGRLANVDKHPNADRLTVCKVDIGEKNPVTIVCGAKNHQRGDLVFASLPGAKLPNGIEIKEAPLRGVTSQGMLCSIQELGLNKENLAPTMFKGLDDGILIINSEGDSKIRPGTPAVEILGLNDVIFELNITPNRSDCLGYIGVARELAAGLKKSLVIPKPAIQAKEQHRAEREIQLKVAADKECPYFTLQVIQGVKVGQSPAWMRDRLIHAGQRPINAVVDIMNYVMLETGQPLHAYDLAKVKDGAFTVRRAKAGMPFKALDGKTYELGVKDLVIADETSVLCLAGVMGGVESGITETTVDIAIEAAYFDPITVRKTAKTYGLHSESSHRFERGVDPLRTDYASQRAVQFVLELCGGTLLGGVVREGQAPFKQKQLNFDLRRFERLVGMSVAQEQAIAIFNSLEIPCEAKSPNVLKVTLPSFRHDLSREVDLVEELARMMGYEQVPVTVPQLHHGGVSHWSTTNGQDGFWRWIQEVKKESARAGLSETISYAFISERERVPFANPLLPSHEGVFLKNPLSEEMAVLKTSGTVGLLQNLNRNQRFGVEAVALFETAPIFSKKQGETYAQSFREGVDARVDRRHVKETTTLSVLMSGPVNPEKNSMLWAEKPARMYDFFDLKGVFEEIFGLGMGLEFEWQSSDGFKPIEFLHPGLQTMIRLHKKQIGWAGRLHPKLHALFGLKDDPVWIAELDLEMVHHALSQKHMRYFSPSSFQRNERDAAFIIDRKQPTGAIVTSLGKLNPAHLVDTFLFDVYEGKGVEEGKKSVGLRFVFQSAQATLTEQEINDSFHKCISHIESQFSAKLRGSI